MKILVLGGEGMLGHKIYQTLLSTGADVACTIRGGRDEPFYARVPLFSQGQLVERVDAMDFSALRLRLQEVRPAHVINCIGVIKQRDEARAALPSITLNALLPHKLAEWTQAWGGRLIHFSTDCVFSGKRGNYREEDLSDAEDLYGKTKYLGEVATDNALTLRTSIIGRELAHFKSLLEWFLGQRGKLVRGYRRVIYAGVTTNYMAQLVARIINEAPTLTGLYQVATQPISKYDLLNMLQIAYNFQVTVQADDSEVSDRSMCGERFVKATGFALPTWQTLVDDLTSDQTPYANWRS